MRATVGAGCGWLARTEAFEAVFGRLAVAFNFGSLVYLGPLPTELESSLRSRPALVECNRLDGLEEDAVEEGLSLSVVDPTLWSSDDSVLLAILETGLNS